MCFTMFPITTSLIYSSTAWLSRLLAGFESSHHCPSGLLFPAIMYHSSSNTSDNLLAPIAHIHFSRSYHNGTRMVNVPRRRSHRCNILVLRPGPGIASWSGEDDEMGEYTIVEVHTPTMSRFIPFSPPGFERDAPRLKSVQSRC
jgi:hypothetical protein